LGEPDVALLGDIDVLNGELTAQERVAEPEGGDDDDGVQAKPD
jgi:hypothetical protein